MRPRFSRAVVPAFVLLTALPAPAWAHGHDEALNNARTLIRTAENTVAATCAAVDDARALVEPILGPLGKGLDTSGVPAVRCPYEAMEIVRRVDELLPPEQRYPTYVVALNPMKAPAISTASLAESVDRVVTSSPDGAALTAYRGGSEVQHVYRHSLRGYAASMSPSQLAAVQADPNVKYVEMDGVMTASLQQFNPPSWGIDRIDQRALPLDAKYHYNQTAPGVKAYVIDSGINYAHPDFGGRAILGADIVDPLGDGSDCLSHGTHVAGTIGGATFGVAKAVTLISVRVFGCLPTGSWSDAIAAVDWVTQDHVPGQRSVVNMSLGGWAYQPIDDAVQASIAAGLTYSVAAGNSADDACNYSPARVPEAMTIGASTPTDTQRWNSNFGPCVDWYAPGEDIVSADLGTGSAVSSGTSMAAPHNAGVAALYLEAYPTSTPAQIAAAIGSKVTPDVVVGADPVNDDLLHVATPLHIPAGGVIEITRTNGPATFTTTGVYATDFTCGLTYTTSLVEVTCLANPNPDIVWECVTFILTATAPAPAYNGTGQVRGRVRCDSGQTLQTADVNGVGASVVDNNTTNQFLGTAYVVKCRAAGINNAAVPTGSWQVTCNEPGARYPYGD